MFGNILIQLHRPDPLAPAAKVRDMTRENIHLETHPAAGGRIQGLAQRFCVTLRFRDPGISEAIQA